MFLPSERQNQAFDIFLLMDFQLSVDSTVFDSVIVK